MLLRWNRGGEGDQPVNYKCCISPAELAQTPMSPSSRPGMSPALSLADWAKNCPSAARRSPVLYLQTKLAKTLPGRLTSFPATPFAD